MGPKILDFQVGLDPASALSWLPQELLSAENTPWGSMVIILAHCSSEHVPQLFSLPLTQVKLRKVSAPSCSSKEYCIYAIYQLPCRIFLQFCL